MSQPGPRKVTQSDQHPEPENLIARADAAIRESELLKREVHASLDAAQVSLGRLHKAMGAISRSNLTGSAGRRPASDEDVAPSHGPSPE